MQGLFGIVHFDDASSPSLTIARMRAASTLRDINVATRNHCAFAVGESSLLGASDARVRESLHTLPKDGLLAVAARIDNRRELCATLGLGNDASTPQVVECAIAKWGDHCVNHLIGDWAFAYWNPAERRLFLARDHHGNTSLYYTITPHSIAFASTRNSLLALDTPAIHEIDDLYLAQLMLSWPVYHGERTAHAAIKRLPPAHALSAKDSKISTRRYWFPEQLPELPLRTLDEAVEGFLPTWQEAVRCRLSQAHQTATTLSGGLDSGAVTTTAARILAESGQSVHSYTSIPAFTTALHDDRRFGDEWTSASLTAARFKNIVHKPVSGAKLTPLQALHISLAAHGEPQHAAGNAFWIIDLLRGAATDGCDTVLTGQGGNGTISWFGAKTAPLQRRVPTPSEVIKRWCTSTLPRAWNASVRAQLMRWRKPWSRSLAIHSDLIARTDVLSLSVTDPQHPIHVAHADSRAVRFGIVNPGRSLTGCLHAENSLAYGVNVWDPTLDTRVIEYCLAVPQRLFTDHDTGLDRMLIRAAMKDQLPDAVRLNQKRGLQAADLPARLRADREAMEDCLNDLGRGVAAEYLDMARLRKAWEIVQQHDGPNALREAGIVLLRAIMVGIFVNQSVSSPAATRELAA